MNLFAARRLMAAIVIGTCALAPRAFADGGPSGGGSGGGGGGTTSSTGVVTFSNFGPTAPISTTSGWAVVGLQPTGFFTYVAEQFTPIVSGSVSRIRLPIHQYDTGGNGAFTLRIMTDSPTTPGTPGAVIGSFQGQSARDTSTALATINVSGGPRLLVGQPYWAEVVPSSQSREAWNINAMGLAGPHFGVDAYSWAVSMEVQGAFEITVVP